MALVPKQQAREESLFFKSFRVKKINETVVTNNKLMHNFTDLVTSGPGPHVVHGPSVPSERLSPPVIVTVIFCASVCRHTVHAVSFLV